MLRSRVTLIALLAITASTACKDGPAPAEGIPVRLTPVRAAAEGVDAAALVDRDTTTGADLAAPAKVTLFLRRATAVTAVRVHGRAVSITAPGLDPIAPAGEAAWVSAPRAAGPVVDRIEVELAPAGVGARVDELEVWGADAAVRTRDPAVLAARGADALGDGAARVAADVSAAHLVPKGTAAGDDCLSAHLRAGLQVRGARRAWLAYEANVPRAVSLALSLNGGAPRASLWVGAVGERRTVLEELDPERLSGDDTVLLCLPMEATDAVDVSGLRLLLVLDDGRDGLDRDAELLLGAAADRDVRTSASVAGRAELGLDHAVALDEAAVTLAAPARLDAVDVRDGAGWTALDQLDATAGRTALPMAGRTTTAVALGFGEAGAPVSEVSITGSGVGRRIGANHLVVSYPRLARRGSALVGERFGDRALVAGWAESPAGPGVVEMDGAAVSADGAFAEALRRPAGAQGPWTVTLRARFPDGEVVVRTIQLDDDRAAEVQDLGTAVVSRATDARYGAEDQAGGGDLSAAGGKVGLGTDVWLEAPAGAVGDTTRIDIARKGPEVMPPLDAGMVNVSAPAHNAYRFLPAGKKFAKGVKIGLPYDPDLLPEGMTPEEIQTYYYDATEKRWRTLTRLEVRRATRHVVSETDHFTFMINAVLVMPDHPGPVSFDPNSIKDLKAADPSAGIDLIEPPQPGATGSAQVAFPIRLPKARGAFQPQLALAYDSEGGNGWVGVGWDLKVSSVSIDTRYGVPVYDGEERYLLDGDALVPVVGAGDCVDGSTGRLYQARVERDFRYVVRCGEDATSFWWEVTDKGGTLYVYGRHDDARLTSYIPAQDLPGFDVGQWFLERVVDANGNLATYKYQHDDRRRAGVVAGGAFGEDFRQVYLREIRWSGKAPRRGVGALEDESQLGLYHVVLDHRGGELRRDVVTSGRLGFKTMTRHLLGAISVDLAGDPIRSYVLGYEYGDFGRSRLKTIQARGAGGQDFYVHTLRWTDRNRFDPNKAVLDPVNAFRTVQDWHSNPGDGAAMTSSHDASGGFHFFGGIGRGLDKSDGTIGVAGGATVRTSRTDATFMDANGDGLPDRLTAPFALLNHPDGTLSLTPPPGDPYSGSGVIWGPNTLGAETSQVIDLSVQVMGLGLEGNFGGSYTITDSRELVLDANGDGILDLMLGGMVLYGQPGCKGKPCFLADGVEAPAYAKPPEVPPELANDPTIAAANAAAEEARALEDVVLEWEAPRAGLVQVSGALQFTRPMDKDDAGDGVRLRIYRAASPAFEELPPEIFGDNRLGVDFLGEYVKPLEDRTATPVESTVQLERGDVLYFVLSTVKALGIGEDAGVSYSLEEVGLVPTIEYVLEEPAHRDPTGAVARRFDAGEDLRVAGDPVMAVHVAKTGKLKLHHDVVKRPSADDVELCLQYFPPGTYTPDAPFCDVQKAPVVKLVEKTLLSTSDKVPAPALEDQVVDVEAGGTLLFRERTDLQIDPATVQWSVSGEMLCIDANGACLAPRDEDKPYLAFRALPYLPIHRALFTDDRRLPVQPPGVDDPFWVGPWIPPLSGDWWTLDERVLDQFVAPADGTVTFTASGNVPEDDPPTHEHPRITFAVRTPYGMYGKWHEKFENQSGSFHVRKGEPVFVEVHSEEPFAPDDVLDVHAGVGGEFVPDSVTDGDPRSFSMGAVLTTCRRDAHFDYGNVPVLPGGYRGWRYGVWLGKAADRFQPWVYRTPKDDDSWRGSRDEIRRRELARLRDPESVERRRLRLGSVLVPKADGTRLGPEQPGLLPDVPAYVSFGGGTYVSPFGVSAGRRGAALTTAGKDLDARVLMPAEFKIGEPGRLSIARNTMAGITFGLASVQIGTGTSQQKQDLLDLNGDRIPDVLVAAGMPDALGGLGLEDHAGSAQITDPATLAPRGALAVPVIPRLSNDVSGQVGLGLSEAIKLVTSKLRVTSVMGRLPDLGASANVGVGMNVSTTVEDLADVNGDGLPDAVRRGSGTGCAGFAVRLNLGTSFARTWDCIETGAWTGSPLTGLAGGLAPAPADVPNPDEDEDIQAGVGRAANGVALAGDANMLRQVSTLTLQSSVGGGGVIGGKGAVDKHEQFGVSVSSESSLSSTNVVLVDVTGDGLPDFVSRPAQGGPFRVMVNLGYGFSAPQDWKAPAWPAGTRPHFEVAPGFTSPLGDATVALLAPGGIDPVEATGTHGYLPSVGFVFTISIPIPKPPPWLHFSFGANATPRRLSGFELGMQDIDGDGFADHVLKTSEHDFAARVNGLAGGNLLAGVDRPLHGSFDIAYERAGNTVDLPQSRWVVSKVTVKDAEQATEAGHAITTDYTFQGGQYDRVEREFRGFRTVTRTNPDRTEVEQTYLVSDFRHKALLERETVRDAQGRVFVETSNEFHDPRLMADADPECVARTPMFLRNAGYCQPSFVGLRSVTRAQWEGGSGPPVRSRQSFDYDDLGNVTSFQDDGDLADANDDVHATVAYGPPEAASIHCTGAPTEITVKGKKGEVLRRRNSIYDARCNMTQLSSLVAGSTWATSDLEWYDDGNLKAVNAPPNHRGERYRIEYEYDGTVASYVVLTRDSHGYVSEAEYDYRFGEPTLTRDVNRNETRRRLDGFGRVDRLAAPGATLAMPTVAIAYHPEAAVSYALTQNRLPTGGTLDTVVVMDGLGRVIQTKKTAEIWTREGEGTKVGWSVTGRQVLDAMGRVGEQHQTVFQGGAAAGYTEAEDRNATQLFYDALGRTVRTVEPGGAVSQITYDIATPQGSPIRRLRTTAVDAMGKVSVVYKDALGKTVATEEHVEGRTPTTTYAYDPVGQLTDVVDAAGNRTSVGYDLLGRRTRLDNPDAGLVELFYDLAGNLTRKVDANLRARGQAITYVYDFERPAEVHYPDARRDVTYGYGAPGAAENGAARVVRVTDEVGSEERGYDALGNVVRTKRTIEPLRPGDRVRTFETTFDFDVYGRMRSMVYPDGEVLKYGYDRGGLVQWARGERPATKHEAAQSETYLAKLLYDEFGQRVYQRVGNGVVTKYGYDEKTRRLGTLDAQKPGERKLQELTYAYDFVGNVLTVHNHLGEADPSHAGEVKLEYRYDDLHRLKWATGKAKSRPGTLDTFRSEFEYSDIHAMTSNVQVHQVLHGPTGGGEFPPQTNHDLTYTYGGAGPHQATRIGDTSLVYDGNGNTVRECRDPADQTCTQRPAHLRRLYWTEENRLDAVIDGGGRNATKFYYDASGERIAKLGRGGESITVGQFWSVKGRRAAMKHVFIGAARVASKLLPPPGWDDVPRGPPDSSEPSTTPTTVNNESGCDPSSYSPQKCQYLPGGDPVLNDYYADAKVRPETYYYHPDHLGSTSWVTDQNARVHERVEYFPYGAVWRDTRSDIGASPVRGQRFLFTGKEIDEETGLYYFGARYRDPVRARWLSPDPVLLSGVFAPKVLSAYLPEFANPVVLVDPDGNFPAPSDWAKWIQGTRVYHSAQLMAQIADMPGIKNLPFAGHMSLASGAFLSTVDVLNLGTGVAKGSMSDDPLDMVIGGLEDTVRFANGFTTLGGPFAGINAAESPVARFLGRLFGGEAPTTAGSIRNVNPRWGQPGFAENCVNCAIATDATLAGKPSSAMPTPGPQPVSVLEKMFGRVFRPATRASIETELQTAGHGSRGIVYGKMPGRNAGHVFNAVNQNGVVRFLDGQTGGQASFNGYSSLAFIRTN